MKVYRLFFPVLFFAGDTMEHNKMSSLQGGTKGKLPCCMCSTVCKHLDSPNNIPMRKMTDGNKIKMMLKDNPAQLKSMGYYACQSNVLYQLQFCDTSGLNQSLPPDILHAVLLGYVTRLINGFAHLKNGSNTHFVFSELYKEEVKRDLSSVGRALSKQSDMNLP